MSDVPSDARFPLIAALSKFWWIAAVRGAVLIVLGVYALMNPEMTLVVFSVLLGCFLVADGVLAIIAAIAGWSETRGWTAARGALALLVGAAVLFHPALFGALAGLTLVFFIAFALIFNGLLEIIVAIRIRKEIEGEGWLILEGVVMILFALGLMLAPLLSLRVFIQVAGAFAILFGCIAVYAAFRLKKLGSLLPRADGAPAPDQV